MAQQTCHPESRSRFGPPQRHALVMPHMLGSDNAELAEGVIALPRTAPQEDRVLAQVREQEALAGPGVLLVDLLLRHLALNHVEVGQGLLDDRQLLRSLRGKLAKRELA